MLYGKILFKQEKLKNLIRGAERDQSPKLDALQILKMGREGIPILGTMQVWGFVDEVCWRRTSFRLFIATPQQIQACCLSTRASQCRWHQSY